MIVTPPIGFTALKGGAAPTTPLFVSENSAVQSSATTSAISVTTPSAAAGDLMIAYYWSDDAANPDIDKTAGWERQAFRQPTLDAEGHTLVLFMRRATGSEAGSYAFNQTSAPSARRVAGIIVYRNVANWVLDPHDGVTYTSDLTSPLVGAAITTDRDNTLALGFHFLRNTGTGAPAASSRVNAFASNRVDMATAGFSGGAGGMGVDVNDENRPTAGATGTNEITCTDANVDAEILTLGLVADTDPLMRFDDQATNSIDGTGGVVVSFPTANLTSGDMQIACYFSNDTAAMTTPSGWTLEAEQTYTHDSETHRVAVFRRNYTSGTSETFNQSGSPDAQKIGWVCNLKNATNQAFDAIVATIDTTNPFTATGVTTGTANELVFAVFAARATNAAIKNVDIRTASFANGDQIRLNGEHDASINVGPGTGRMCLEINEEMRPSTGATGTAEVQFSDFGMDAACYVFAIQA